MKLTALAGRQSNPNDSIFKMKEQIRKSIRKTIAQLYPEHANLDFSVDYAPDNIDADFASNVAMVLAKKVGEKPMEIGEEIALALAPSPRRSSGAPSPTRGEGYKVETIAPGFLNFKLGGKELLKNLNKINKEINNYGKTDFGKGKLAIVEYFQLNVAKPPHVGHLRSAVIGDSLKRILSFIGYKTVSDTHLGDWGTQLGIFIHALKNKPSDLRGIVIKDIASSAAAYAEQSALIESQPELREAGKAEFALLEKGDPENKKYWADIVEAAKKEVSKSVKNLTLLPFDHELGESFYESKMGDILKRLEKKNLLVVGETGEKYVDLEKYGLGRLIGLKSDGATTYELRDLATLAYRYDELANGEDLALNLYVVDSRQSHDFKQVFRVMEMLGYDISKSKHVDFGYMSLPKGPISTRKGNVVSLEKLIAEAKDRALRVINEKNPGLKNKEKVADQVGLAAVKYFDLKHNRRSDIIFNWDEALSFEGNAGPYLQYTHARFSSILRKANVKDKSKDIESHKDFHPEQYKLLHKLYYFPDIVIDSAAEFMPSILATYLYELAETANNFYHEFPVTQEKDEEIKKSRLALVKATTTVLQNGLYLLGITAPEEM
ncbi:MAG: arginine--tRNA ligase [bacterium]|nr:arginine--tRNA ligase [bacterium]